MARAKIAITIEQASLQRLDELVSEHVFSNRSQAIQSAINDKLARLDRVRLMRECAKLDPAEEKAMAEEGIGEDATSWPEY